MRVGLSVAGIVIALGTAMSAADWPQWQGPDRTRSVEPEHPQGFPWPANPVGGAARPTAFVVPSGWTLMLAMVNDEPVRAAVARAPRA